MTAASSEAIWYPGHWASLDPARVAATEAATGATMTYGELHSLATRFARTMRRRGLQVGDHIAWCVENRLEFLAVAWCSTYAGLHYTTISRALHADEIAYIENDCGARAFLATPYKAAEASRLRDLTPGVEHRFALGGDLDGHYRLERVLAAESDAPMDGLVEGVDMLYSSGTTGRPKGVKFEMRGDALGTKPAMLWMCELLFGFRGEFVYLSPAPLYHGAPLRFCLTAQRAGGTVVVMPKFDAEDALAAIERYRVTTSQWVPTMFTRMLQLPDEVRARYDLSSLIHAVHAAAPCPIPVKKKMIEWWGPILHEYYSGTEGAGFTYVNSPDWLAHPSTVGRPLVGSVHICDDDGNELPVGEAGAVFFNSGAKFEYHGDAAKTKESRHPKGWTSFGDVGRVDRDGFLHLKDRKAFLIISGGVNIYPQEAENVLAVHPKVYDVAVFGVPNPEFGEEVKAVVQPIDWPATDGQRDALAAELIAWCREHLASLKCPRSVDFHRELPRHPTGKLLKRQLRDEYWGGRGDIIVHRTET
jgi:acyl-CoA synthetase (AMP-forming)/AMP-acid ligase II